MVEETSEARCLGCGYALRGLGGGAPHRCPKCGRTFDPQNPLTMDTPERTRRALRRALWWAPVSVYIATFVLIVAAELIFLRAQWLPLVLAFAVVAAEFLRRRARKALLAGAPDPSRWSERLAGVGTFFLVIYIIISPGGMKTWSCPHGTGVRVGPITFAYSTVGGPCRAQAPRQWMWNVRTNWYVTASPLYQ